MIAKATIEGKEYKIPLSYKDITLAKFKRIQTFVELNKTITDFIIGDEKAVTPTEEELLNYYIRLVSIVTDIPHSQVMRINRFTIDDEVGIEDLFKSFSWLYLMPTEEATPKEKIGDYYFIDKSGVMKDNSLIEYTEANAVSNQLSKIAEGRYEHLNTLLAIFYRPRKLKWFKWVIEDYNSETVKERAKYFDSVDMETVFNCMFFFIQSRKDYLKSIEQSLEEELVKELKQVQD